MAKKKEKKTTYDNWQTYQFYSLQVRDDLQKMKILTKKLFFLNKRNIFVLNIHSCETADYLCS